MSAVLFSSVQIHEIIQRNKRRFGPVVFDNPNDFEMQVLRRCAQDYGFTQSVVAEDFSYVSEHYDGAVLIIHGPFDVDPACNITTKKGNQKVILATMQETVLKERMRLFAQRLMAEKQVVMYQGCDEEYLYEVLIATADLLFEEQTHIHARGLPIFQVKFDKNGGCEIEDMGET